MSSTAGSLTGQTKAAGRSLRSCGSSWKEAHPRCTSSWARSSTSTICSWTETSRRSGLSWAGRRAPWACPLIWHLRCDWSASASGLGRNNIPFQVGTLIESVEQWKELEPGERDRLLEDPWAFKEFLFSRRFESKLLVNSQNTAEAWRGICSCT